MLGFITAYYSDADLVVDLKLIALKHLRETLIYDLISTLPCLITFYGLEVGNNQFVDVEWCYYFRLVRLYKLSYVQKIFKNLL